MPTCGLSSPSQSFISSSEDPRFLILTQSTMDPELKIPPVRNVLILTPYSLPYRLDRRYRPQHHISSGITLAVPSESISFGAHQLRLQSCPGVMGALSTVTREGRPGQVHCTLPRGTLPSARFPGWISSQRCLPPSLSHRIRSSRMLRGVRTARRREMFY